MCCKYGCVSTRELLQLQVEAISNTRLLFAQIRKSNVDRFSYGQMIPKCELLFRWPHTDRPHVCLEHEMNLLGAKGCSSFTLYIPDAGGETYSFIVYVLDKCWTLLSKPE